ncbi:MAG: hypothetical protein ACREH3_04775, partial [Geminicoccales bacterium]
MARRLALGLAFLLALLVLVVALAFGLAQTTAGKRLIASQLESMLSAPGREAQVEGLKGVLPFEIRLARLTLSDRQGVWLEAEHARFAWSPAELLRGRLAIEDFSVGQVEVARLPESPEQQQPEEPFRLPELPRWMPAVSVQHLGIGRLDLAQPVLGEAASFTLAGKLAAAEQARNAALELELHRVDEPTARAAVQAIVGFDPASLQLTARAEEEGGLLALVTGWPEAKALAAHLSGSGPLDAWSGQLEIDARGLGQVHAALGVETLSRLRLNGTIEAAPGALSDDLAALVGKRLEVGLVAVRQGPQQLAIESLQIGAAAAALTGRAKLDLEAKHIDGHVNLAIADLAPLGALASTPLAGAAHLVLDAKGALLQPEGRLELDLSGPRVGEIGAGQADAAVDFALLAPFTSALAAFEVSAEGNVVGLQPGPGVPLPPQDLTWRLDAQAPPGEPVAIQRLALN